MSNEFWQSKHYKKIFRTIYLASLSLLVIAMIIMYFAFLQINVSYLDTITENFMSNVYSNIENRINTSIYNALNISTSADGIRLLNTRDLTQLDYLHSVKNLDYFFTQDSNVHSVLLYNSITDSVFMFGSDLCSAPASEFYDREIIRYLKSDSQVSHSRLPRVIQDSPYAPGKSTVITSIHRVGNGNAVVVNLDVDYIFSVLNNNSAVYSKAYTNYLVTYDCSMPLYENYYHEELQDSTPLLMESLNKHHWSRNFNDSINGKLCHFQVVQSQNNGVQIVSIIRKSDVSASFLTYLIPCLIIAACFILISAFVNIPVSKKLYSPIVRIRKTLMPGEPGPAEKASQVDEIDLITTSIADKVSQMESLFTYKKQRLSVAQETFLKTQLFFDKYTDEEFWDHCEEEELPYRCGDRFILVYARWLPITDSVTLEAGDQELLCFALSNVLHELLNGKMELRDIPFEKDGIAYLFSFREESEPAVSCDILNSVQEIFRKHFELSVSFFISDVIDCPHRFCPAMQKLQELSTYRYFYSDSCILHVGDIDFSSLCLDICTVPDTANLESLIRGADWEGCREIFEVYFKELHRYSRESASASVSVLASRLISMLKKIESTSAVFPKINYHLFYKQISTACSISRVRHLVEQQLREVIQALSSEQNNSAGIDARDVQQHLEMHFQDFEISSKSVATDFHVSVPYLNRIFKQKTGESISSYVKKLRLEKASYLLQNTSKPVEVIAKDVGFENTKYFYSLFKKEYGISPSSYRTSGKKRAENTEP